MKKLSLTIIFLFIFVTASIRAVVQNSQEKLFSSLLVGSATGIIEAVRGGADVNKPFVSEDKKTPLYIACDKNDLNAIILLLTNGAEKSVDLTRDGKTPLYKSLRKK